MSNREVKTEIIKALMNRHIFTKKVNDIEYQTRCPYCGDTQKNFNDGHLYMRINPNDNFPIVYNCFKCPAQGILKYTDLELFGIEDLNCREGLQNLNKSADKFSASSYQIKDLFFEYKIPSPNNKKKINYIENRLGLKFTDEDLKNMKVITSLRDFLLLNDIHKVTCKPNFAKLLDRDYVGFLNNNNAYILFRDVTEKNKISWFKYPITEESRGQRNFYSIKSEIDLYTDEKITINLSEGVMDCLSIAYNLEGNNSDNVLNVAICGKYYMGILKYLIGLGFVGDNICVNIYSDNDHTEDTSIEYYKRVYKKFSYLFGSFNIFYNLEYKDCGVPKDKILLQKHII